jgi:hypothetical protein
VLGGNWHPDNSLYGAAKWDIIVGIDIELSFGIEKCKPTKAALISFIFY